MTREVGLFLDILTPITYVVELTFHDMLWWNHVIQEFSS
jgi:hypothetical protein